MKIVNLKQLMKNQTSISSDEEEYYDQLYQKQPKGLGEVRCNNQHQAKQKYHFGYVEEQFYWNEICYMQTEFLR